MEYEKALILSECTDADELSLESDTLFQKELEVSLAQEEARMLQYHRKACQIAAMKGSTTGMQWKLGKMNPDKWGEKKIDVVLPSKLVIDSDDKELL